MSGRSPDIAIVGGGLAGGLIALAVRRARPDLSLVLVEAGECLGGNHRWSWFDSDLDGAGSSLLAAFETHGWDGGNEVRFPAYSRLLAANYRSLDSRDFDAGLRRDLPASAIRTASPVSRLEAGGLTLETGETIGAGAVIDCRAAVASEHLSGGWQVFLGQHLRTWEPHGIERPVIMDAAVDQLAPAGTGGAYRFVYLLPLGRDEIFVEDTYYADAPALDAELLRSRIAEYAATRGWQGEAVHEETGVLPVITAGNFAAYRASLAIPGVALAGARGGFTHPLTSYTMPIAVRNALALAAAMPPPGEALSGEALAGLVARRAAEHWRETRFYRSLGRMLFDGAEPDQRYRVFERFYRLPEQLIERFYAARSTRLDRTRILCGKPPMPIPAAIRALAGSGTPLSGDKAA